MTPKAQGSKDLKDSLLQKSSRRSVERKRPLRPSIKKDRIHPKDFNSLNIPFACEDCAHFNPEFSSCTIGFWTKNHLRHAQLQSYFMSGEMAICRFMEVE